MPRQVQKTVTVPKTIEVEREIKIPVPVKQKRTVTVPRTKTIMESVEVSAPFCTFLQLPENIRPQHLQSKGSLSELRCRNALIIRHGHSPGGRWLTRSRRRRRCGRSCRSRAASPLWRLSRYQHVCSSPLFPTCRASVPPAVRSAAVIAPSLRLSAGPGDNIRARATSLCARATNLCSRAASLRARATYLRGATSAVHPG
jgi:hypothetical protein